MQLKTKRIKIVPYGRIRLFAKMPSDNKDINDELKVR